MMMSRENRCRGLAQAEERMRRGSMEPKRPGLPSAQPEYTTRQAGGALEQGCWRKEGGHREGRHEEERAALPGCVRQGPPLRHGSHQNSPF